MKAVVLKPMMWNTNGYIKPSGYQSKSGFAKNYGYGHEEWNNSPRRVWRGYKVFHTEAKDKLLQYSSTGELAIITTASFKGDQYAVSIATSVFQNDLDERKIIAQELNIYNDWKEVWSVGRVRQRFNNNKQRFLRHWQSKYEWIRWKCPIAQYHHFNHPVRLDPKSISGKARLVSMHSSFQAIYPEQALHIIGDYLSEDHPISEWLSSADFDEEIVSRSLKNFRSNQNIRLPRRRSGSNSPAIRAYQYWVEGNRSVEPHHALLQAKYVSYLSTNGVSHQENCNYVDVKYQLNGRTVFAEVKPTEKIQTKYAIRIAVGQLLEYRYSLDNQAILEIVLGSKPTDEEIAFVTSLGICLTYLDSSIGNFIRTDIVT
ncbi:MAG TPA: hypothetical protein VM123_05120 [archaeon]|nr:hypothetical protein [archaeon]